MTTITFKNINYTCKDSPNEFNDLSSTEKSKLLTWISQNLTKIKSINNKHSSYTLKKLFEKSNQGFYITNGQFKGAMLESKFEIKSKYEQNWYFNISEKSIKKLKSNQ